MNTRALMTLTAHVVGFALLALTLTAHATTIGRTTLGKFISGADVIIVGQVARVVDVPAGERATVSVAEVEVVEWVKGKPRPKRIWYLADGGTSGADWSSAVKGEKALLFLSEPQGQIGSVDEDLDELLKAPNFWKHLKAMTGGAPLLRLCWAGRGRMPLGDVAGVECATLDAYYVTLPADMPQIPGADPRFIEHERRVPLAELLRRAKRRLVPVTPPNDERAAAAFELLEELDSHTGVTPSHEAEELLEKLGEEAVPVLLELLDDPAFPWRDTVAEALLWSGSGIDAFVEGLRSKDPARRRASAFAIEWVASLELDAPNHRLAEVFKAAADPDPEVRARAVEALGATGHRGATETDELEAVAAVVNALTDKSFGVRRSAVRGLIRMRVQFYHVEEFQTEKAESALIPMTVHDDLGVRREAWEVLARVAGPATLPTAMKALEDADQVIRGLAILALGRIPAAAKRLTLLLGSKEPRVRCAAAHAFGSGKAVAGVGPLARALGDPDEYVVRIAVDALGEIGPPAAAAVPALERLLAKSDEDLGYWIKDTLNKIRK